MLWQKEGGHSDEQYAEAGLSEQRGRHNLGYGVACMQDTVLAHAARFGCHDANLRDLGHGGQLVDHGRHGEKLGVEGGVAGGMLDVA